MIPQRTFRVDSPLGSFTFHLLTIKETLQTARVASAIWGGAIPSSDSPEATGTSNFIWNVAELKMATSETPDGWTWDTFLDAEATGAGLDQLQALWEGYSAELQTFRSNRPESSQTART